MKVVEKIETHLVFNNSPSVENHAVILTAFLLQQWLHERA